MARLFAIALGGAVGAVCRYGVVVASLRALGDWFPFGVLVANVLGCFSLGLLMHEAVIDHKWLPATGHAALTIGVLGAMTTFSTFGYDTFRLMEGGRPAAAIANVIANCVVGVGACWVGHQLGDLLWPASR